MIYHINLYRVIEPQLHYDSLTTSIFVSSKTVDLILGLP